MAVAVVDTGVLVGVADAEDRHHEDAIEIVREMDRGRLPTGRVTNYVVLETLNWIHARKRQETAVDLYRRLNESAGFGLVQTAQADFGRAVELFEQFDGLSFGDATTVAYMQREGIEHLYAFDDDFDAVADLTRLTMPTNPFE